MLYRLSRMFGKPVSQLEQELTAEEVINYQIYYDFEPWGCEAEDYRCSHLSYITAQSNSTKKLSFNDFKMPWRRPTKQIVPFNVGLHAHVENMRRQKLK